MRVKSCSNCGKALPLDQFSPDRRATSGLQSQCRSCMAARVRELRGNRRPETFIGQTLTSKVCPSCTQDMPVDRFSRNAAAADGLQTYCKACYRAKYPDTRNRDRTGRYYGRSERRS